MDFHGIYPAMLTPFRAAGEKPDEGLLREYVDFLVARGVHGLFPTGTNGAGPLMSTVERKGVTEVVVDQVRGRVPVLVQAGAISTQEALELSLHAREVGATAVGLLAPYYFDHDELALETHFASIADRLGDFPVFLYNIPGNAKNDLKPGLVRRLAERHPNVIGIKDSSKDQNRLQEYIKLLPGSFTAFVGTDSLVLPALVMGAKGAVTGVGNVFPEVMVELYSAYSAGDLTRARELQYRVMRIRDALKAGPAISAYHMALQWRGVKFGPPRPPFRPMTREEEDKVRRLLEELEVMD
ncbi:MAG: dihydrodipicolinate synthase family protein [Firmicutes bacterium]|nr:dihydrodipicolinate synthase family protein [Bacillota bacterium]MCL5040657.1 dihydrodipicolinate synthase family protein [Bacillota bacterium]